MKPVTVLNILLFTICFLTCVGCGDQTPAPGQDGAAGTASSQMSPEDAAHQKKMDEMASKI